MVVERDKGHLSDNIVTFDDKLSLLKTAAILGPNGSGKTNLLFALDLLADVVVDSGNYKDGDNINEYMPYLLSPDSKKEDTCFELEFLVARIRYKYVISFNAKSINYESLHAYLTSKPSKIFERTSSDNWRDDKGISFGPSYKGGKKRHAFFL
jgi:AAA15 family ATPase/GTPase